MKKILFTILCIVLILALPGCWSRREPKTLAIINSTIYDYQEGIGYQIITEILNPSASGGTSTGNGGGGGGKSPNITIISVGPSIPEAIRNASDSLERTIFGGHNMVRFFSERFAQRDMAPMLDYVLRDFLTDENPLMVVIKGDDPQKIYTCLLGLSSTVGNYIDSLSESQPHVISNSVFIDTLDFVKDYYDDGIQPVAGLVQLVECESKSSENQGSTNGSSQNSSQGSSDKKYKIVYEGLAAFKDNRLVGYMNGLEARSYNILTNNTETAPFSLPSGDDYTVVLARKTKSNIQTVVEDEQITISIRITTSLSLIQASGATDISTPEPLKALEDSFNTQLSKEASATIRKAQTEFQSDIFGFGKLVHSQHPEKWKEIKENWDDYFSKAAINISVESSVYRSGQIKQPFTIEGRTEE